MRKLAKAAGVLHTPDTMKKPALLCLFAALFFAVPVSAQGIDDVAADVDGSSDNSGNNDKDNAEDEDEESKAEESDANRRFWQASVPGGHYMVALSSITSISMHQYVLDTQLLVTEMVIDTNGRSLARFYYVTAVAEESGSASAARIVGKGRELLDRAGQRAGTNALDLAQKNYPATSHAGMVEYRLLDVRDLNAIYKSVQNAWETGKGRKITVK
jgi:hypothetical protein